MFYDSKIITVFTLWLGLFLVFSLPYYSVFASKKIESTDNKNLFINSDSLNINQVNKTIIYKGNVRLEFKDIFLSSDIVIIFFKEFDGKRSIDKVVFPQKVRMIKNVNQQEGEGEIIVIADKANFEADTKKITFIGNVIIQRYKDSVAEQILKTNEFILVVGNVLN